MWQNANHRLMAVLMMTFLASPVLMLPGCGNNQAVTDGSTIVIDPSSTAVTGMAADTTFTYTVTVRYPDGTPFPGATIRIAGSFAVPRNIAGSFSRYQFIHYGLQDPRLEFPIPVDSGYTAVTDEFGNYHFSILVYGTVGGAPNVFTDQISVSSGSAFQSIELNFS